MGQQVQYSPEPGSLSYELERNSAFGKIAVSGNEGLASWEKVRYHRGQQKEVLDTLLEMCLSCDLECCVLLVRAM